MGLLALHAVMAFLALGRWTELATVDQIVAPLRRRFPGYLLGCPRCVSVWAGVLVTGVYLVWPYGNWPLGLSALYIWTGPLLSAIQTYAQPTTNGRRLTLELDSAGAIRVTAQGLPQTEVPGLLLNAYNAAIKANMPPPPHGRMN